MIRLYLVLGALHALIGWRLLPGLTSLPAQVALISWLVVSTLLIPQALRARRSIGTSAAHAAAWVGLICIGSFSTLLVLTILRDVVLLGAGAIALVGGKPMPAALTHWSAAAVPLLTVLLTALGYVNARRRAPVRRVDVPIKDLPPALHGFAIAQISDVHVGPTIRRQHVEAIVDAVNGLEADLIAVTGDLVDGSVGQLAHHTQPLARLSSRHGAFFVTGNHEYYSGAGAWVAELRRLGLRVLMNEHVVLEHQGTSLVVAGITDYSAHHFDETHRSDPHAAIADAPDHAAVRLLLAHQPRSAMAAAPAGFQLQLSGHTHGGQFFPWNLFVRLQQPFTAGLHRLGDLWVYTSRGTGYWGPPKRLGAPSEITHLRLVPA